MSQSPGTRAWGCCQSVLLGCLAWPMQTAASQQNFTWSPDGALVAHTLVYRSTAGILGSSIASAVMIVSGLASFCIDTLHS